MRVLMLPPTLPFHTGGGVAMVNWAVLRELRARGHQVLVAVDDRNPNPEVFQANLNVGAEVALGRDDIPSLVSEWKPDVLFCYSVYCLQKARDIPLSIPRVCALVDLDHMVPLYRRQYVNRSKPIDYNELVGLHKHAMGVKEAVIPHLQTCAAVIEHAHHHNQWLNEIAGVNSTYIPMPVADPTFPGWIRDEKNYPRINKKIRVAMAGHLGGIATLSGLYFLTEDTLPHLSPKEIEIRIAGAEGLFPDIATRLKPHVDSGLVRMLGYVPDIQKEMMISNLVLVPTPIDLGFRTRIVEAWSLACPTVIHKANTNGMPEAEDEENCVVGENGAGLAEAIMVLGRDRNKQIGIGGEARTSYETHFRNSESKVVDVIEGAAKGGN